MSQSSIPFDSMYQQGTPPWDIGSPQPAIVAIADELQGSLLDVGCGTGEHALFFAARGLDVLGLDFVPRAIELAQGKARARGSSATFQVGDALHLDDMGRTFDHVIDSGLFHVFEDADRARYVDQLGQVLKPGGVLHLLCFSEKTPGTEGPRRVSQTELQQAFAQGWRIDRIIDTQFQSHRFDPQPRAWLARIVRDPKSGGAAEG